MFRVPMEDNLDVNGAIEQAQHALDNIYEAVPLDYTNAFEDFIDAAKKVRDRCSFYCHQLEVTNEVLVYISPAEWRAYVIREENMKRVDDYLQEAAEEYSLQGFNDATEKLLAILTQEHRAVSELNMLWYPYMCDLSVLYYQLPVFGQWKYDPYKRTFSANAFQYNPFAPFPPVIVEYMAICPVIIYQY